MESTGLCPSPPLPHSEEVVNPTPKSPMETVLSVMQSHSPGAWLRLVRENDPDQHYVVTAVSHYREKSPWPDFQPEYLALVVQPHPDEPQPVIAPTLIKVSRNVLGHALPARLGLWGSADDTVTVMGPAADIQLHDKLLHQLTWAPKDAPRLKCISRFMACIHYDLPESSFRLKISCHGFVRAILETIHIAFNGIVGTRQPRFLTANARIVHLIPPGTTRVHAIAQMAATHYRVFHDVDDADDAQNYGFITPPSYFTTVFPVGITSTRKVAKIVAATHRSFHGNGRVLTFFPLNHVYECFQGVCEQWHLCSCFRGFCPGRTT